MPPKRFLLPLGFFLILLLSNRWPGWEEGKAFLFFQDVPVYEEVTKAAPRLPTNAIPFHHGQRFVPHYALGLIAKITQIPYPYVYRLALVLLTFATVLSFAAILAQYRLSDEAYGLCMALFIFNPYNSRFYWIIPGMIQDVAFVAALSWILLALVRGKSMQLLMALFCAALCRQTALILIPSIAIWLLYGTAWKTKSLRFRLGCIACSTVIVVTIFFVTAKVAQQFEAVNDIASNVTGLWTAKTNFSGRELAIYFSRLVIPFMTLLGVLLGFGLALFRQKQLGGIIRALPVEVWACLLTITTFCAQPAMAGPQIAGRSASRLAALTLLPALTAFALFLEKLRFAPSVWLFLVVFAASFHHMYSLVGPPSDAWFALEQVVCAGFLALIVWKKCPPQVSLG